MLKRIVRGSIILVLAFMPGACGQAVDMRTEYEEIDEEKSKLIFYGPGLAGGYRQFLTIEDKRSDRTTVGTYGARHGGFPRAKIELRTLARGAFKTDLSLPKYVARREFFKGRVITPGIDGKTSNAIGRIRYLSFMADDNPCVAFQQFLGRRVKDGKGDKRLVGYYCKREGPPLTTSAVVEVVRAIGHREHGAPKPPPEWGEE